MIQVVLWDVDGTLLNFQAAEKAAIAKCFGIFGLGACTDAMIAEYAQINARYWRMLERGERTKPEILVGRFSEFFALHGIDTAVADAFNSEYQIRLGDTICFFDHALETVKALKGRVLQCAVTNGTRVAQDRKLRRSGLGALFDKIFISEDLGIEKPNKGFFDHVFSVIGDYPPDAVVIVGDSLTSDMQGGNNAGIRTCWFNPRHEANGTALRIDREIADLGELLNWSGAWSLGGKPQA